MAEIVENEKGFKVISCSMSETTKFGGMGICDDCNGSDYSGYLICVLNRWYCKECYLDWEQRAKYYPEDSRIEERNFNHYRNLFKI